MKTRGNEIVASNQTFEAAKNAAVNEAYLIRRKGWSRKLRFKSSSPVWDYSGRFSTAHGMLVWDDNDDPAYLSEKDKTATDWVITW